MSPEDPNNPGLNTTNPDLSSVPLPEPSPIKSPYAPVGGTLGDVANDVAANDPSMAPQASAVPTAGIITEDPNTTPAAPSGPATLGDTPVASDPNAQPAPAPAAAKPKGKKLPLIIGIIVAVLIIVGVVLFLVIAKPFGGQGGGTGGGTNGEAFYKSKSMVVSSSENGKKYAIFSTDGDKITDFVYDDTSGSFVGGAALMKKDGKYGIVGEDGSEIVKFGESGKIKAYGALYGLEKDGKKILVNNKGEKVVEYEDENLDHYSDYTSGKETAYTIFKGNENHYTIYNPYGAKVTEFDSVIAPTVTTPEAGTDGASSVIVYSGGVIILNDKGGEVRRVDKNITKKYFGVFVSKSNDIVGLSTTNEALVDSLGTISSPDDKRENMLLVKDTFHEYTTKECAGLYYDDDYAEGDEDGFVLCVKGYENFVITNDGSPSSNTYNASVAKSSASSLYKEDAVYPITNDAYALLTQTSPAAYGIFYGGKKVVNLVSTSPQYDTDSANKTKTSTKTEYHLLGMNDNYVVQQIVDESVSKYKDSDMKVLDSTTTSLKGKLVFIDKKGKEICTFDKKGYTATTSRPGMFVSTPHLTGISSTDVTGFVNGFALVRKLKSNSFDPNGYTLINNKCEVVNEDTYYYGISREDDLAALTKKSGDKYVTDLIDKNGETIASSESKYGSAGLLRYMNSFGLFGSGPKYFIGYGKALKKFDHFCNFNSGISSTGSYVELITGTPAKGICDDTEAVAGEHYYFTPNGKEFYKWSEGGQK
ncbi:hypothetical protein J5500_04245 [Candidatus Saccharibacteria bacterium]|nr:hypothetical protein [Candidatus Saccharibacteria bacterium]